MHFTRPHNWLLNRNDINYIYMLPDLKKHVETFTRVIGFYSMTPTMSYIQTRSDSIAA